MYIFLYLLLLRFFCYLFFFIFCFCCYCCFLSKFVFLWFFYLFFYPFFLYNFLLCSLFFPEKFAFILAFWFGQNRHCLQMKLLTVNYKIEFFNVKRSIVILRILFLVHFGRLTSFYFSARLNKWKQTKQVKFLLFCTIFSLEPFTCKHRSFQKERSFVQRQQLRYFLSLHKIYLSADFSPTIILTSPNI